MAFFVLLYIAVTAVTVVGLSLVLLECAEETND